MKNKLIGISLFFILLLTSACGSHIHKHFNQNAYSKSYTTHVFNDSLQLSFITPGDIHFVSIKKDLKKELRERQFPVRKEILIYGQTNAPEYVFILTTSAISEKKRSYHYFTLDTLIGNQRFTFLGEPISERWRAPMEVDLSRMMQSLKMGNDYNSIKPDIFELVNKFNKSVQFYNALAELRAFPVFNKNDEWLKMQMELTFSSMLLQNEDYASLLKNYEARHHVDHERLNSIKSNHLTDDRAIEAIISEAKKTNIVMINENHFYPNHRLLLMDLLPKLKEIGYSQLAIEALYPMQDSALNTVNGHPTIETGFYTKEQNFSNLIRLAKALDFEFVSYENEDSTKAREIGQAENLFEKTIGKSTDSKVVVLAGIDHILERPTESGKRWLATELHERYNINPLTISQTHLNVYRHQFDNKYVMISGDSFSQPPYSAVDFHLLNNQKDSEIFSQYFSYKNEFKEAVQICLFRTSEMEIPEQPIKNIPYFTKIAAPGELLSLPFYANESICIVAYDINGKKKTVLTKSPLASER